MCYNVYMKTYALDSKKVFDRLNVLIDNPESELNYSNEFELLIAVMLSAQCTDKRVNMITSRLFQRYKTPSDFANSTIEEVEEYIKSCNYYHNKAKNIINACKTIVDKFAGKVPCTHDELVSLPGVGNKTANVVQAVAFGQQALPVDTHVMRVSNRLGVIQSSNPNRCEVALKEAFFGYDYVKVHHLLLLFGRYHCTARNPKCENCVLRDICVYIKHKEC